MTGFEEIEMAIEPERIPLARAQVILGGVSRNTIMEIVKAGKIRSMRDSVKGKIYIDPVSVKQYVSNGMKRNQRELAGAGWVGKLQT